MTASRLFPISYVALAVGIIGFSLGCWLGGKRNDALIYESGRQQFQNMISEGIRLGFVQIDYDRLKSVIAEEADGDSNHCDVEVENSTNEPAVQEGAATVEP